MEDLYLRLAVLNLPRFFVRSKVLPDWWDEEYETTSNSMITAAAYISRRLNLDFDTLLDPNQKPRLKLAGNADLMVQLGHDVEKLSIAHCIATRIGELIAYAYQSRYKFLEGVPISVIRANFCEQQSCKHLNSLLELCWNRGIPIVYVMGLVQLKEFPKFHSIVLYFNDRPVIILSPQNNSFARLFFLIAHNLEHIQNNQTNRYLIVDEMTEIGGEDAGTMQSTNASTQINACLNQHLNWELLSQDNQEFVELMTGLRVTRNSNG